MGGNSNAINAAWIFNEKYIEDIVQKQFKKLPLTIGVYDNPYLVPYGNICPYKNIIFKKLTTIT